MNRARRLIQQARKAIAAGNLNEAKKLAEQARAKKANLGWWADNPDKIMADVRRLEEAKKPAPQQVAKKGPDTKAATPASKPALNGARNGASVSELSKRLDQLLLRPRRDRKPMVVVAAP